MVNYFVLSVLVTPVLFSDRLLFSFCKLYYVILHASCSNHNFQEIFEFPVIFFRDCVKSVSSAVFSFVVALTGWTEKFDFTVDFYNFLLYKPPPETPFSPLTSLICPNFM